MSHMITFLKILDFLYRFIHPVEVHPDSYRCNRLQNYFEQTSPVESILDFSVDEELFKSYLCVDFVYIDAIRACQHYFNDSDLRQMQLLISCPQFTYSRNLQHRIDRQVCVDCLICLLFTIKHKDFDSICYQIFSVLDLIPYCSFETRFMVICLNGYLLLYSWLTRLLHLQNGYS